MVALYAPVKLGRRLVSTSGLKEPPESFAMTTLGTINFRSREGIELRLLLADDLDLWGVGKLLLGLLHDGIPFLLGISAVVADVGD